MTKAKLFYGLVSILASGSTPAGTTYASLSNFEALNDSETTIYHDFKIELEGIASSATANYSGGYSSGQNRQYGTRLANSGNGNTFIRYYGSGAQSTAPYALPINDSTGHFCITTDGCEYLGQALHGNPSLSRLDWRRKDKTQGAATGSIDASSVNVIAQAPTTSGDLEHTINLNDLMNRPLDQTMVTEKNNGPMTFLARVPVPAAVWLFGSALAGLIGVCRRSR